MSVSTSRHHADWLSLVEVSGPFVSLRVLLRVFPQVLESRDAAQAKALRAAYDEWQDNPTAPGRQRAWVLHVLTALLGYPADLIAEGQTLPVDLEANMAETGETLRPDFALVSPSGTDTAGQAQLLIASYHAEQALDHPVIGKHWKANPATRMTELLHASGVALGLVTNGEQWMLVFAPRGETTGYASWYSALWLDEPITLRAFHSLLGARRFFGVAADSTLLGLLKESAQDQQEVTDQLGYQVRQAVEVLVQAFDTLDQDSNRTLLKGVSEAVLYEAALTVMMRLVFLFSAEERGLLHLGKPLYDDNYAVSTLLEQLQEVADLQGPQVLERRFDAWARLLATFRAVHAGVHHQDLLMPAYGGSLFDPDRYPFLEGRGMGTTWTATQAQPLAVNNRVALHLLTSLQRLRIKVSGGGPAEARRVSFRALGVEQIGHVYEGLLDHTAVRATETVLGIKGTRGKEAEIALTTLEAKLTQGQDTLIEFLKDETGRAISKRAMEEGSSDDDHKLLIACGHEEELLQRVRPFAGFIRDDSFERPLVVLPGSIYVTVGTTRRSTGTHYTPPSLTVPIVQYTLEPLVYHGPAEGLPREQWQLKPPKDILALKVCDMAMGSGAFLVQVCRYLAERLTESWENEEKTHPNEVLVTPEGGFSQGSPSERLVPQDPAERLAIARRFVADRCLYGVDINPMAVEMAKLSLWLITLDSKRPFTFLDHAFKCGDSLLGLCRFEQLENFSLRPEGGKQNAFSTMNLWRHIEEAKNKREALEAMPSDTSEQIAAKSALYAEAEEAVAKLTAAADVLLALELKGLKSTPYEAERAATADQMMGHWQRGLKELRAFADELLMGRRTLHWPLAFPEIIEHGGFHAFVGNPPYLGGKRISFRLGEQLFGFLKQSVGHAIGTTDLCVFFLLRGVTLLREMGCLGFIVSDIVRQGDSRVTGLEHLPSNGCCVFRAYSSTNWPGAAGVKISHLHIMKGHWEGRHVLDDAEVKNISSFLRAEDVRAGQPLPLAANQELCFTGHYLMGQGFVLSEQEANELIAKNSHNREVIFDYVRGDDVNNHPLLVTGEKVINFDMRSLDECRRLYPECLERVERLVKPERDSIKPKSEREHWWRYARARPNLKKATADLELVMVQPFTAKFVIPCFVPAKAVFAHPLVVIADSSPARFAVLQSTLHLVWVWEYCSTSLDLLRYTASDVLETFPFPANLEASALLGVGQKYIQARDAIRLSEHRSVNEIYNQFHNANERSEDILRLRALHMEMDRRVATAYGWTELELDHGFHETRQGLRFTISEAARREVLDLLLALNHQRHAEEEAAEVLLLAQSKPTAKRGRRPRSEDASTVMGSFEFGGADDE
jgi:hypothetical protein